jgi:acyl-CoA synthetase (AMP-forming)/AMP-acid ligase II
MSLADLLQIGSANLGHASLVLATGEEEGLPIPYGALCQVSRQFVQELQSVSLGSGDVVGLVSPHSLETAMALVAVGTSGLTCAPIDPAISIKRFKEILEETCTKLLLVGGQRDRHRHRRLGGFDFNLGGLN